MKNLVTIQDKQVVTTSLAVADGCQLTHRTVIRLVRKYETDFQEFGTLNFESSVGARGGSPVEFAILNEDQATYLITLFRNTDIVRRFKIELVKAFRRAINQLGKLRKSDPDFKAARVNSKAVQRTMTDMSSPRPWGCFSVAGSLRHGAGVFPTPVGVFPVRERLLRPLPVNQILYAQPTSPL